MGFNGKTGIRWSCTLLCLLTINLLLISPAKGQQKKDLSTNIIDSTDTKISDSFLQILSEQERAWLNAHPVISVALDPGWPPVEFTDENGKQSGMSMDYLELVEQRLGMKFKRMPVMSWADSYAKMKRWEIDMTTSVASTELRTEFWTFTKPYMNIPIVIATQADVTYIAEFQELSGKKVALVEGYAIVEWMVKEFPEIMMVNVKTALEGLEMLQRGEVFAYIDNLLIIGYYQAKMQVSTIKIAGQTPYVNNQCMAVRKDWAPLAGILQKALESISEKERNAIYRKWLPVRYEHGFNYTLFWQVLGAFAVIVMVLLFWNRQLAGEIRSRKRAEEENVKLHEQLHHAQKIESIGRLAGGVAHDFNNMLMVILGNADMALATIKPSSPLHDELTQIKMAANRSADLTRQLLAFARKQVIAPKVLDMNETLEGMLKMMKRLIGENIELVWLPGKKLWTVRMDTSQIDQIFANLCVNARDAINVKGTMDGIGKILIETANVSIDDTYCSEHLEALPGDYVKMTVSDDGCGIEKDILKNLFEPFFTTKGHGKGTGLGLATVYGIVKQNKGFINVYSEPEKGTVFSIYLPRHVGNPEYMHNYGCTEESTSCGNETILLVEDESAILKMGKSMLEGIGYKVIASSMPSEAIRMAQEYSEKIDLLMTDVVMPEMSGRDLSSKIMAICPDIRCLFMSGYTANVIAHNGVLDQGVHFIQKPFSRNQLAMRVKEVMHSS